MSAEDYQDALRTERHDGTDDPDLHDAGEHPALDEGWRMAAALDRLDEAMDAPALYRLAGEQDAQEMARLEHARIVAALLAWREVDRVETPGSMAWWTAVYPLRDIADRIAGQGVSRG